MFDIMEERVTLVEALDKSRQPFPEMEAIYFVSPSPDSVARVVKDFTTKNNYASAHIFFLSKVGPETMRQLQSSSTLVGRIKTFKELNIDFLSFEQYVFHLDTDAATCFRDLYGEGRPSPVAITPVVQRIAAKLLTVCASLHECPVIRCRANSPMQAVASCLVVRTFPRNHPAHLSAPTSPLRTTETAGQSQDGWGVVVPRATRPHRPPAGNNAAA
jgi:hypothetical protein